MCELVPTGRGPAPAEPTVPAGPNVQENFGKPSPAATYEDMIKTAHDEDLFEYYFTSQLAAINIATGAKTPIGRPAIFASVTPSPSNDYLLVSTVKRPFSHLIPMNGFPEDVEIWDRKGAVARKIADRPSREGTTLTGVEPGPRGYHWRADQPATIIWTEALDGGDLKNKVPFRDKVVAVSAPFTAQPTEIAKTEWRFGGISFTEKGVALLSESDRASRHTRTWILEPGAEPRKLWDRKQDAAYDNPGNPMTRRDGGDGGRGGGGRGGGGGGGPIMQNRRLHLSDRPGIVAGRRSAVPRSAEPEDAADRAALPLGAERVRDGRGAARRQHEPVPHALRVADRAAQLLRAQPRHDDEAAGDEVHRSAAAVPRRRASVRHLQAQGRRHAVRRRCTRRPATRRATSCR